MTESYNMSCNYYNQCYKKIELYGLHVIWSACITLKYMHKSDGFLKKECENFYRFVQLLNTTNVAWLWISCCLCWQKLEEHITKNSANLGRDAQYTKSVSRHQLDQ